jgi:hypothetical protein
MAKFKKGQSKPPRSGRRKGTRNKTTVSVRRAVDLALNEPPGAVLYLKRMRDSKTASDRQAFLRLVERRLPRVVEVEGVDLNDRQPPVLVVMPDNGRYDWSEHPGGDPRVRVDRPKKT